MSIKYLFIDMYNSDNKLYVNLKKKKQEIVCFTCDIQNLNNIK